MLRPGDFLGFSSRDAVGTLVNLATLRWPCTGLSHCGIVVEHPDFVDHLVLESTSLCSLPCAITGEKIAGVQMHKFQDRWREYRGRVWHYPLAIPLDSFRVHTLTFWAVRHLGIRYDALGALRTRALGFWQRKLFGGENLGRLFCSELVAAAYREIGVFKTENASAWNPNSLIRALLAEGIVKKGRRLK